ncbi:hypothetical protein V8F33_013376 [Rhypophila sp. PSN 637]
MSLATSTPTLVIEAGFSQTMDELRNDMRWWFNASNHDVKIVLLVKMYLQNKEIWIERWQEVIPPRYVRPVRRGPAPLHKGADGQPSTHVVLASSGSVGGVMAGVDLDRVENLVQGSTVVHHHTGGARGGRGAHSASRSTHMRVIDHTNRWSPSNYWTPIRLNIDMK